MSGVCELFPKKPHAIIASAFTSFSTTPMLLRAEYNVIEASLVGVGETIHCLCPPLEENREMVSGKKDLTISANTTFFPFHSIQFEKHRKFPVVAFNSALCVYFLDGLAIYLPSFSDAELKLKLKVRQAKKR